MYRSKPWTIRAAALALLGGTATQIRGFRLYRLARYRRP
jgi:hypothetical protein